MAEFELREPWQKGLFPSAYTQLDSQGLVECKNAKPTPEGLVPPATWLTGLPQLLIDSMDNAGIVFNFPFPQIFVGRKVTLVCEQDKIWQVIDPSYTLEEVSYLNVKGNFVANHYFKDGLANWHTEAEDGWDITTEDDAPYPEGVAGAFGTGVGHGPITQEIGTVSGQEYVILIRVNAALNSTLAVKLGTNSQTLTVGMGDQDTSYDVQLAITANGSKLTIEPGAYFYGTIERVIIVHPKPVVGGDVWHHADFGDTYLLFNGSCTLLSVVYWEQGTPSITSFIDTDFVPKTGCNFRGRLMMSGFGFSNFWKEAWTSMWNNIKADLPGIAQLAGLNKEHTWFSSITGEDMLQFFMPETLIKGPDLGNVLDQDYNTDERSTLIEEIWARNEQGHRSMPWQGYVQADIPMKEGVIIYTQKGIGAMVPVMAGYATFGFIKLLDVGIAQRGCVGGNDELQIFIDNLGVLYAIKADFTVTRLGYEHFLAPLIAAGTVVINYNQNKGEFYISGEDITYVLTTSGMGSWCRPVVALPYLDGNVCALTGEITDEELRVETGTLDFANRGVDTIRRMEAGIAGTNLSLTIRSRINGNGAWNDDTVTDVSRTGKINRTHSGVEFRFRLVTPDYTDFTKLDYLKGVVESKGKRSLNIS